MKALGLRMTRFSPDLLAALQFLLHCLLSAPGSRGVICVRRLPLGRGDRAGRTGHVGLGRLWAAGAFACSCVLYVREEQFPELNYWLYAAERRKVFDHVGGLGWIFAGLRQVIAALLTTNPVTQFTS